MRLLALLAVGVFAGGLTAEDKKEPAKADEKKVKDEEAILGTWQAVKLDLGNGTDGATADQLAKVRVTFKKDGKARWGTDSEGADGEYKIDASAKPKAMDLSDGGREAKLAVYELDGDTLSICLPFLVLNANKSDRPTELKAEGKYAVMTLKRVKDEPKRDK